MLFKLKWMSQIFGYQNKAAQAGVGESILIVTIIQEIYCQQYFWFICYLEGISVLIENLVLVFLCIRGSPTHIPKLHNLGMSLVSLWPLIKLVLCPEHLFDMSWSLYRWVPGTYGPHKRLFSCEAAVTPRSAWTRSKEKYNKACDDEISHCCLSSYSRKM